VSSVTYMDNMFNGATAFNQDLSSWVINDEMLCFSFNENTPQWTLPKPNLDPSCLE